MPDMGSDPNRVENALTGLMFRSAASASGQISSLSYSISGSAGEIFAACVLLVVGPATPALCTPVYDRGAGNNIVTSVAIAALLEATLSSSGLAASGLPTEEKNIVPSDAGTQQSDAQNPNVAQVTGEMQPFDLLAQASNLETDATNSTGPSTTATDSAPARNVGSSSLALATTPASTSILQGNGATEIKAPSDVAVSFLQSTVAADVLLAPLMNATAPTAGNSLIAPQLTNLSVTPTPGNTSQTSTSAPTASTSSTSASFAALAAGSNAIALENMKQGTPESEWLIDRGDPSIEGFAAQFTINHGQRVDFKINTNSTNYRIDIYRIGYYNGDGARKVATIDRNLATAQVQPAPLFDSTRRLVDAGNWSVSASWNIPADAVSGVYFAKLTRLDAHGGANMIPFIVRDDENASDITFQTSDTTWQAYNSWGGYNFYGGVNGRDGRAYAVSYNRPIVTRDGGFSAGPQDFIFGVEYPAIRWLEQNGYDVNYISGIDTARSGAQLLNSKVFLSVGHDEYWSADQRANVEAARNAGVNLAFLSGNEVYWQTRWESSIDGTGTPYKTLVSYKERWANANIDTNGTTSTWRDPELGSGRPENGLTGTIFTVDSYRLDTITIPYNLSNFRFWKNTAVDNIQPGQVYSLVPNLLGYEWDSDLDNGARPAGLIALSSTTVNVDELLLDYGNTTGPGTATHSLTLYRAPSGALVFGAGTVYWSWGLDANHDLETTPTDRNVQQAMVNLFADMGVQPSTLMASLAIASQTTDNTKPTTTITSPTASGSYTAARPIVISGTAADAGGGSVAVVEVSTDGGTSWHRATGFENWTYTWVPLAGGTYNIKSRAVDDSVNLETPGAGRTITVAAAPVWSLFSPSATPAITSDTDVGFVNLGVKFTSSQSGTIAGIKFYKGLGDGGTHVGSLWSGTGTLLGSATFTQETAGGWQTVTFNNPISITAGTTYVASYRSSGHYANTGNYFAGTFTNGPLTAQVGNGFYTYSANSVFPTTASNGTNYWVDVIFAPVNTPNQPPVAVNDSGFTVTRDTPMTFAASVLLANDTDPNGDILSITGVSTASGGSVNFNSQTNVVTFTPNAGYTGPASFSYAISDGRGVAEPARPSST
ncbi:hypothetical protein V1284_000321 [Nitrobacteraceae bacterium AZCC 2299]